MQYNKPCWQLPSQPPLHMLFLSKLFSLIKAAYAYCVRIHLSATIDPFPTPSLSWLLDLSSAFLSTLDQPDLTASSHSNTYHKVRLQNFENHSLCPFFTKIASSSGSPTLKFFPFTLAITTRVRIFNRGHIFTLHPHRFQHWFNRTPPLQLVPAPVTVQRLSTFSQHSFYSISAQPATSPIFRALSIKTCVLQWQAECTSPSLPLLDLTSAFFIRNVSSGGCCCSSFHHIPQWRASVARSTLFFLHLFCANCKPVNISLSTILALFFRHLNTMFLQSPSLDLVPNCSLYWFICAPLLQPLPNFASLMDENQILILLQLNLLGDCDPVDLF